MESLWRYFFILAACFFSYFFLDLPLVAYGEYTFQGFPPGFLPRLIVTVVYTIMRTLLAFFISVIAGLKKKFGASKIEWILALLIFGLPVLGLYSWISSTFRLVLSAEWSAIFKNIEVTFGLYAIMWIISIASVSFEFIRVTMYLKAYRRFVLSKNRHKT